MGVILFAVPGRLPGLNEYTAACRDSKYGGNRMKAEAERRVILAAKAQLRGVRFQGPVVMHYTWVEPDRRRDKDNIAFAKKFVQDALVKCGVLKNDGWGEIDHFTDAFAVDRRAPRVEVRFEEKEL